MKMKYFFAIWVAQGQRQHTFTAGDLQAYDPGAEWTLCLQAWPADNPTRARAEELLQMVPRLDR